MYNDIPHAGDKCTKCSGGWAGSEEWDIRCEYCRDGIVGPSIKETEHLRSALDKAEQSLAEIHAAIIMSPNPCPTCEVVIAPSQDHGEACPFYDPEWAPIEAVRESTNQSSE